MSNQLSDSVRVLEQLCNTAAVLETGMPNEVLEQLLLLHLAIDRDNEPTSIDALRESLHKVYGVAALPDDLRQVVDRLQTRGQVVVNSGEDIVLSAETLAGVREECSAGQALEERVRDAWLEEIRARELNIPGDLLWAALEEFIQSAFARHGMQTAILIDPGFATDDAHEVSLSALQNRAISKHLPPEDHDLAAELIAEFFARVGESRDRVRYVGRLADTAHAFFVLHVSPDVAHTMRSGLSPITVFLDTNFLFAFLGLHSDPFLEVSNRLVDAVSKYKLPVKLRYHEETAAELKGTLDHYRRELIKRRWSQALSRAAVRTGAVSGVELEYHRRNAEVPTDVAVFFKPLEHFDVLLRDKGIEIYRGSAKGEDAADGIATEYERELAEADREKPAAAIEHDARVLATVRALRSEAASSLEAGALLVTCDYSLFRFDNREARRAGVPASVLLPNMLWQILRAYVPTTQEYDRAFADTFALPEFRTIQSRSGQAASKMLSYLATYGDLAEETATRLLSNEVVLRQLSVTEDEDEVAEIVDSELARLNEQLLEERAALANTIKDEARRRAELEEEKSRIAAEAEAERERMRRSIERANRQAQDAEQARKNAAEAESEARSRTTEVETEAARTLREEREERLKLQREHERQAHLSAFLVSLLVIVVHLILWLGLEWPKALVTHDRALAMELLLLAALVALAVAIFEEKWRKYLLGSGVAFALIIAILQLL